MIWDFGNRCGHRRGQPRLRLAFEPRVRRPPFIRRAQGRCDRLFFARRALLARHGIAARSESAEAIVLVLKALLTETCEVTLRVGWRRGEEHLAGVPATTIARWTGLNLSRVVRALCTLMHAQLLAGRQAREQLDDGRWVGLPKVRRLSWRLFYLLGIDENELRQAAAAAQERRRRAAGPSAPASSPPRQGEPTTAGDVLRRLEVGHAARLERLKGRGPPDG